MDSKSLRKMGLMCLCEPSDFPVRIRSEDASSWDTAVTREMMARCLLSYGFVSNVNALLLHLGRSGHAPTADLLLRGRRLGKGRPHKVSSPCET